MTNKPRTPPNANPATTRELVSWSFYDFANSGYTTVVLTAVYSAYFVAVVAAASTGSAASSGTGTLLWTLSIALANLIVLFSGPLVGAFADYRACKKTFLLVTTLVCIASTALLALAGPGHVGWAMLLVVVSAVAFASGENLIAAFLPEIAAPENMGRISGYGWSLGYFGGLLTLGICLAYIQTASSQGQSAQDYVPVTLIITATIFALAAAPTFIWLQERAIPQPPANTLSYLRHSYVKVRSTLAQAWKLRDLFRFLISLTLFQSGVATVVVVAAIYAQQVMGFSEQELIMLIMVVNLTAAAGAFGFGYAQDRFGSVPSLAGALLVWIAAILVTFFADKPADIWLAGNLMGLAMGATQSGGRALVGRLTPVAQSGEFFGLWGVASRAAAILGPLSYGLLSHFSSGDHRMAMLSTLTLFLAGLLLLLGVDEKRGIDAATQNT